MDKSLFDSTVQGSAHHSFTLAWCIGFPGNICCGECLLITLMHSSTNSVRQTINIPITGRSSFLHCRTLNVSQCCCQNRKDKKMLGAGYVLNLSSAIKNSFNLWIIWPGQSECALLAGRITLGRPILHLSFMEIWSVVLYNSADKPTNKKQTNGLNRWKHNLQRSFYRNSQSARWWICLLMSII